MLSNWPLANTRRWAAFRRKGAEILTVLLVVVLLERMFVLLSETVQLELGGLTFLGAGPLTPVSPRCEENRKRAPPRMNWERRPFLCYVQDMKLWDRFRSATVSVYRPRRELHDRVYRHMRWADGKKFLFG